MSQIRLYEGYMGEEWICSGELGPRDAIQGLWGYTDRFSMGYLGKIALVQRTLPQGTAGI